MPDKTASIRKTTRMDITFTEGRAAAYVIMISDDGDSKYIEIPEERFDVLNELIHVGGTTRQKIDADTLNELRSTLNYIDTQSVNNPRDKAVVKNIYRRLRKMLDRLETA